MLITRYCSNYFSTKYNSLTIAVFEALSGSEHQLCVCRHVDAADSSEDSFRTSSSGGCDVDCSSSVLERSAADSSTYQQLSCVGNNVTSPDVTSSSHRCHGNGDDCGLGDWHSQRWRHWQQMTMMSNCETDEQLTLV